MTIREKFLYGLVRIETSPWATPFAWTDRTADLVAGVNYSLGGRVGQPGSSPVDVGTLNATFKNTANVPTVGSLVRLSIVGTAGYAFVGYVQDVSERIVFDQSVSLTNPVTLSTINCVDWVGYVSQFQVVGVGGANATTGVDETDSTYQWVNRIAALNKSVDATYATKIISAFTSGTIPSMGDTDIVNTISDHLDLVSRTAQTYWHSNSVLPTDKTTGRTGLVTMRSNASLVSSGKLFTDLVGTASQLHYTEIDIENSSQNVANTIIINNRARMNITDSDITQIGGFAEENFLIINNAPVIGIGVDHTERAIDATSITNFGVRQIEIDSNVPVVPVLSNLITNPSVEYSDDGYTGTAGNKVRRRKPLQDANPFAAYSGEWAMRMRTSAGGSSVSINFSGGESDGIPVTAGRSYVFQVYAARGTVSRTDGRALARVTWIDEDEAVISQSSGTNVSLTTVNTWYQIQNSVTAPANAVRATVSVVYSRSGGGNHGTGDIFWADGFYLTSSTVGFPYFDGDSQWTTLYGYLWTGNIGASPSIVIQNDIDDLATTTLARYSTTSNRVTRIRWNAQEDLAAVIATPVGSTIQVRFKGTTTTHRIVGINGSVDSSRYMIDYYLEKV
jgi:hypothetical protein